MPADPLTATTGYRDALITVSFFFMIRKVHGAGLQPVINKIPILQTFPENR